MTKVFLAGNEGDFIAPTILLDTNQSGYTFDKVKPLEQSTRSFVESKGYRLATIEDVEIRPMGKIGEGLFAKRDIAEGTVIGVCGGTVVYIGSLGRNQVYTRDCTSEELRSTNSFGAMYHYTYVMGTGDCAADKIQHAFDNTPEMQRILQQKNDLFEHAAFPNVKTIGIQTEYDFAVILLVADRPIKKNEIFLNNYGPAYVFGSEDMDHLAVFNNYGEVIAELKTDKKEQTFSVVADSAQMAYRTNRSYFFNHEPCSVKAPKTLAAGIVLGLLSVPIFFIEPITATILAITALLLIAKAIVESPISNETPKIY